MSDLLEQYMGEEEGRSTTVYLDSRGFQTIGIGALVDKRFPGAGLCDDAISAQFAYNAINAIKLAAQFPGYSAMNDVRQAVLEGMCFQMYSGPLHWPDFMKALSAGNFQAAAVAGLDSDWAQETPTRARRAMYMLKTGEWLAHGAPVPTIV